MIHHVFSNVRWLLLTTTISLLLINQYCRPTLGFSWSWSSSSSIVTRRSPSQTTTRHIVVVSAKRRKNDKQQQQQDNAWYEEIDQDATPDEIFWSEMERQKAMAAGTPLAGGGAGTGGGGGIGTPTSTAAAAAIGSTFTSASPSPFYSISSSSSSSNSISSGNTNFEDPLLTMKMNPILSSSTLGGGGKGISAVPLNEERATEKTLALYAPFMVENNWLNEEYGSMMLLEDVDIEEQNDDIDKQFAEWEKDAGGGAGFGSSVGGSVYGRIEPWDRWNGETKDDVIEKGRRRDGVVLDDDGKEDHMVDDDDYDVEQTLVKSEMQNKGK